VISWRGGDLPAWDDGRVNRTRLVTSKDAPALADLLRVNREFLAPWEPIRSDDFFTADGQHTLIQADLQQHEQGSKLPRVILDDSDRVIGRITLMASCAARSSHAP
jgi:[ribosomal protein S5]-alanine N-acetyltransferase